MCVSLIYALWSPTGKELTSWLGSRLWCPIVSLSHFPIGILGQVWYLIVSIPDLCTLTYFATDCDIRPNIFMLCHTSTNNMSLLLILHALTGFKHPQICTLSFYIGIVILSRRGGVLPQMSRKAFMWCQIVLVYERECVSSRCWRYICVL